MVTVDHPGHLTWHTWTQHHSVCVPLKKSWPKSDTREHQTVPYHSTVCKTTGLYASKMQRSSKTEEQPSLKTKEALKTTNETVGDPKWRSLGHRHRCPRAVSSPGALSLQTFLIQLCCGQARQYSYLMPPGILRYNSIWRDVYTLSLIAQRKMCVCTDRNRDRE